ncbi:MAG: type I restriction enzyme HsdR N-terminal domain-containing protein [Gammaproteobacteria bacterium]|nr:type I restriction enzyme HsdR N-terminal domain-containing protein [Gammaproteobacteria bacterium]
MAYPFAQTGRHNVHYPFVHSFVKSHHSRGTHTVAIKPNTSEITAALLEDVGRSATGAKRLKLRTLLSKFGYANRSDSNTAEITQLLTAAGLGLNPPIVRLGNAWEIKPKDWIYLSCEAPNEPVTAPRPPPTWNADGWFNRIVNIELRTEKEVENKFIIPLLARLGYGDDDRYDGMPIPAANGSRNTTLIIDFALFNSALESLRNQPLLTVEAKREGRLTKQRELMSAHNQAKSYSLWTQCDFFMVTDSRTVQVFHIARGRLGELAPLFACQRNELPNRFDELYARISKEALTRYYLTKLSTTEEAL